MEAVDEELDMHKRASEIARRRSPPVVLNALLHFRLTTWLRTTYMYVVTMSPPCADHVHVRARDIELSNPSALPNA